ncbi:hypothetical protein NKR19_g4698 [Coniochaeta hoffmannii]|uniref:Uncharacterized protein n=1 Tax=Coniochaeta hoffmannii TaxID=91930 RepID=A0AA38RP61_9PEZI|nr:hypothetical protein NKR19_g4698 [Coniochaeta hoffmannii]
MSGQQRTAQGEHHGHHGSGQHHQHGEPHHHLHNPTGYTDEVADEEREFMMQAERSAGVSESAGQNTKGQDGGLGSSNIGQQASSTVENVKNKAKETLNMK